VEYLFDGETMRLLILLSLPFQFCVVQFFLVSTLRAPSNDQNLTSLRTLVQRRHHYLSSPRAGRADAMQLEILLGCQARSHDRSPPPHREFSLIYLCPTIAKD
jgi:hypothetical protein